MGRLPAKRASACVRARRSQGTSSNASIGPRSQVAIAGRSACAIRYPAEPVALTGRVEGRIGQQAPPPPSIRAVGPPMWVGRLPLLGFRLATALRDRYAESSVD